MVTVSGNPNPTNPTTKMAQEFGIAVYRIAKKLTKISKTD